MWSSSLRALCVDKSILSTRITQCETDNPPQFKPLEAPPKLHRVETFEEKLWRKFSTEPLVPIGCAATFFFLVSGIRSFQRSDPIQSQKMMKSRVAAQFATLLCLAGYVGWDMLDFRLAPMYRDARTTDGKNETKDQV